MSPGDRCDEVIRLIDRVLADSRPDSRPEPGTEPAPAREDGAPLEGGRAGEVEEPLGRWGVYYLRPSA